MSAPLRVLHAIHDFLPRHQAGSEIYVADLAAALQRRGHHVTVLTAAFDPSRRHGEVRWHQYRGLPVVEIVNNWAFPDAPAAWMAPEFQQTFEWLLEATDPDILHVHSLLNLSFDLPAIAKRRGVPAVATLHDYTLVCPSGGQRIHKAENHICYTIDPERCSRCFTESPFFGQLAYGRVLRAPGGTTTVGFARHLVRAAPRLGTGLAHVAAAASSSGNVSSATITARLDQARQAFEHFDLVVAPSPSLAAEFRALGFPSDRIQVMDYGFSPLAPVRTTRRPSAPLRVGFLGSIVWHKGVHVLVEAVRHVPKGHVEASVFGDLGIAPEYVAELRRAADGWPIRFEGRIEHNEVAHVLARMDVLVVPSIWLENSPLVIHEAFMAGVPVVGARIGGIADLIDHNVNGVLYPPDSAEALATVLSELAADRERVEQMAARAPAVTTMAAHAAEWEGIYGSLRINEREASPR